MINKTKNLQGGNFPVVNKTLTLQEPIINYYPVNNQRKIYKFKIRFLKFLIVFYEHNPKL